MNQVKSFFFRLNGYQQNKFFLPGKIWSTAPFISSCNIKFFLDKSLQTGITGDGWSDQIYLAGFLKLWASLVAQLVENLAWDGGDLGLGWEDSLEEGVASHSSILAWRIPMNRGAWWAAVHGVVKSQTRLSD